MAFFLRGKATSEVLEMWTALFFECGSNIWHGCFLFLPLMSWSCGCAFFPHPQSVRVTMPGAHLLAIASLRQCSLTSFPKKSTSHPQNKHVRAQFPPTVPPSPAKAAPPPCSPPARASHSMQLPSANATASCCRSGCHTAAKASAGCSRLCCSSAPGGWRSSATGNSP